MKIEINEEIIWWNSLSFKEASEFVIKHYGNVLEMGDVTKIHIKKIYKKEFNT